MDFDISRAFTIDFETTDKDPKIAKPVEVAVYGIDFEYDTLINPGCPIPPETSAIHHISDDDVVGLADWDYHKQVLRTKLTHEPIPVLIAHNAEYERTILGDFCPVLWVCTYKCALRVWPDAPAHRNEVLRYWLKLGNDRGRNAGQRTHSAMHDARVTFQIFEALLEHATIDQLVEWTEQPAKLPRMPMGKHFGQTWDTVPAGYLQWVINQADMREDVKYCAVEELKRRQRG